MADIADHRHHPEDGHVVVSEPSPEQADVEAIGEVASAEIEIEKIGVLSNPVMVEDKYA